MHFRLDMLLGARYELGVREPGHRMVRTPALDVHVHILGTDDPAFGDYILLRDQLRKNAEDRALYEGTKKILKKLVDQRSAGDGAAVVPVAAT